MDVYVALKLAKQTQIIICMNEIGCTICSQEKRKETGKRHREKFSSAEYPKNFSWPP